MARAPVRPKKRTPRAAELKRPFCGYVLLQTNGRGGSRRIIAKLPELLR